MALCVRSEPCILIITHPALCTSRLMLSEPCELVQLSISRVDRLFVSFRWKGQGGGYRGDMLFQGRRISERASDQTRRGHVDAGAKTTNGRLHDAGDCLCQLRRCQYSAGEIPSRRTICTEPLGAALKQREGYCHSRTKRRSMLTRAASRARR